MELKLVNWSIDCFSSSIGRSIVDLVVVCLHNILAHNYFCSPLSCHMHAFLDTQVVAGLNYKFTLAILEGGNNNSNNNNNNNNNNIVCRGFLRGITVYKPLPHTGQGLSVTSWGKQIDCTDEELLKLLKDATNDATTMMAAEEEAKENALDVEDNLEEEWEEVEPDS